MTFQGQIGEQVMLIIATLLLQTSFSCSNLFLCVKQGDHKECPRKSHGHSCSHYQTLTFIVLLGLVRAVFTAVYNHNLIKHCTEQRSLNFNIYYWIVTDKHLSYVAVSLKMLYLLLPIFSHLKRILLLTISHISIYRLLVDITFYSSEWVTLPTELTKSNIDNIIYLYLYLDIDRYIYIHLSI